MERRSNDRKNDERDRLRQSCADELRDLHEASDDEDSQVAVNAAAQAAARTAARLSRPDTDTDAPERERAPWHRTQAGKGGLAVLIATATGAVVTGILQALHAAGIIK